MDITSEFAIEGIRQADRIIEELESCLRDAKKKPSEMKGIFIDADDAQEILDLLKYYAVPHEMRHDMDMENWEIVQRNKETGEEKLFMHDVGWNVSKEAAEKGAEIRRRLSSDKWEVFIRQVEPR